MKRSMKKPLCAATLALASLALGVLPAVASSLSAGTSVGGFNDYGQQHVGVSVGEEEPPTCIENTTDAVLTLDNTEIAVPGHLGNTTATVTIAAEELHFNPAGTFMLAGDPNGGCEVPGPVPAKLEIAGHCEGLNAVDALYLRVGEVATVTTTSPCGGHIWEFEGSQQPCIPGAPFDPCAIVHEWEGAYEAIPA